MENDSCRNRVIERQPLISNFAEKAIGFGWPRSFLKEALVKRLTKDVDG